MRKGTRIISMQDSLESMLPFKMDCRLDGSLGPEATTAGRNRTWVPTVGRSRSGAPATETLTAPGLGTSVSLVLP